MVGPAVLDEMVKCVVFGVVLVVLVVVVGFVVVVFLVVVVVGVVLVVVFVVVVVFAAGRFLVDASAVVELDYIKLINYFQRSVSSVFSTLSLFDLLERI